MPTSPAVTISVSIEASADAVYRYARDPMNLPTWAAGFATSARREGDRWIVRTADGDVFVEFAADNPYGVLDHHVWNDQGLDITSRMRVVGNGSGSEVIFTLFRAPGVTEMAFAADRAAITSDLQALKRCVENA